MSGESPTPEADGREIVNSQDPDADVDNVKEGTTLLSYDSVNAKRRRRSQEVLYAQHQRDEAIEIRNRLLATVAMRQSEHDSSKT